MDQEIKVGSRNIKLTNPDKLLFKKAKITKEQFVAYYIKMAKIMLTHIKNRPITMQRFPNGPSGNIFYQKDAGKYVADWLELQPVKKEGGGIVEYILANNEASIVYLANLVCVPHVWLSRVPKLDYPDRLIFDCDPGVGVGFAMVRWAARELKNVLEKVGLTPFIMTTGSRGVHVTIPLKRMADFDMVREFAQDIAKYLVKKYPKKLTLEMRKAKRGKRIFLDTLRNAWGATAVAPYAIRAIKGAPIATPISWQELGSVTPTKYTLKNIGARISGKGDLWKDIEKSAKGLSAARKKLDLLLNAEL